MTLLEMEEDTVPSNNIGLAEILQEGLVQSDDPDNPSHIARFHRLFEVLFEHCLLRPHAEGGLEHVEITLSMLAKRSSDQPELLISPYKGGLFYSWLLTRLIIAATSYEEDESTRSRVFDLCDAASLLLSVLARDLGAGETCYMRGPERVAAVLGDLVLYAQDTNSTTLLGHEDMPSGDVARLLALHIALHTRTLFLNNTERAAAALCDFGDRLSSFPPTQQALYTNIVAAAIKTVPIRHVISRACVAVVTATVEDDVLETAVDRLILALEEQEYTSLRCDVWWALLSLANDIDITSKSGLRKIIFLLWPIPPLIPYKLVVKLLPPETLQRWADSVNRSLDLRGRLSLYIELPQPTSVKRKYDELVDDPRVVALRRKLPDLNIDGNPRDTLSRALAQLDVGKRFKLLETNPSIACILAHCHGSNHNPLPAEVSKLFLDAQWEAIEENQTRSLLRVFGLLYRHKRQSEMSSQAWVKPLLRAREALKSPERATRHAAANLLSVMYADLTLSSDPVCRRSAQTNILATLPPLLYASLPVQETTILLVGDIGRNASDAALGDVLEILLKQFASSSAPLRGLAYTQLVDIAAHRQRQPYNLLSPYLDRIGVLLAECLVPNPEVVAETMSFIGYTRQAFFTLEAVRKAVLPHLVVRRNRAALESLAGIFGQFLALTLLDEGASILAEIFLHPESTQAALEFVDSLLGEAIDMNSMSGRVKSYIRASIIPLVVTIAIELGDEDPATQEVALSALHAVRKTEKRGEVVQGDLGLFLKPHMLGILAAMTELLMTPKTPVDNRRKIIRSVGKLISLVGDSMASFSPQIMACLQGALNEADLRLETLSTWGVWVDMLKFSDVGPYIGPTIATLVAFWPSFSAEERKIAKKLIIQIAGNRRHFEKNWEDIVRFDHIPELAPYSKQLLDHRSKWSTKAYLENLIVRTESKSIAISTASMRELRNLLQDKHADVLPLMRGDTFDPIIPHIVRSLLQAATRDGDCQDLRDLSYECFGLLGAVDPDRFVSISDESSMTIMSNFTDHDESIEFAIHLLRDLLTGAFRGTNDTKHQKNLSFTIQELLKFCEFDSTLVNSEEGKVNSKVRQRWERLPRDTLETVTPLLDALFRKNQIQRTEQTYPIYPHNRTYREWVQAWTVDLIGRVLKSGASEDATAIFGAFYSEPRNQDVAVAHHLLPHLVLHVLLSGDSEARQKIKLEIHEVLRDQVSPVDRLGGPSPEKRMLSAQLVFDLLDHLSKWLRLARSDRERSSHTRPVDTLLQSIDTELTANAALKSRAFARSLRNFEERIVYLRTKEERQDLELQPYFESLHEIYAELDDPDGMEGISASVVSPSLELQIREHESTGRWTSAQSCWEVRLQHSPDDVNFHVGLLKCLKNLGHYDTLRTHISGILDRHPNWDQELAPFRAEAAWAIGDWDTVRKISFPPAIAQVFLAIQSGNDLPAALQQARREVGRKITTREYSRAYDAVLQLHMIREVEMIHATHTKPSAAFLSQNAAAISRRQADDLVASLSDRFQATLPTFRVREELLNKRRAALSLVNTGRLRPELGQAWIQSARIARKAGYEQTAYSAALQAREAEAPFAFIQQAKLVHSQGGILKALRELEHPVKMLMREPSGVIDLTGNDPPKTEDDFRRDRSLAKAVLLEARWARESDRFEHNEVLTRFKRATELGDTLESPFFHLGRYYDTLSATSDIALRVVYNVNTCINYSEALKRGVKYIYQTVPRLLTVWLDLAESKDVKKNGYVADHLQTITTLMDKSRGKITTYQLLTAFPQMMSRITHTNKGVQEVLIKLVSRVIRDYPLQALWTTVGAVNSNKKDRQEVAEIVLQRSMRNNNTPGLAEKIRDAKRLSKALLRFSNHKPESKMRRASVAKHYPYLEGVFPSLMILPLQDALTCVLPSAGSSLKGHQAFPGTPVTIIGLQDEVEIMPSLQQPKKLVFRGSDGKRYPFLCKPHDDLRKDARLMDMNSMINGFLRSASESRKRHLCVRTYAVMPLNEECGLIEWVPHTSALKRILEEGYARQKKKVYSTDIYQNLDAGRKAQNKEAALLRVFRDKVIPQFRPTVFHEWFLIGWPEPTAWLAARTNYARTLAVMSMIGYVLGLGDRHGENILFDASSGDTVHVDLNCLFEKAATFDVPEKVPFRLTQNMQDALGVTGVEGVFRKAAEITMTILRSNGDSLNSVLEAFVHDPLVEWTSRGSKQKSAADFRSTADKALGEIAKKLRGVRGDTVVTVPNHVESLIKEATSLQNLSLMYVGWAAWL